MSKLVENPEDWKSRLPGGGWLISISSLKVGLERTGLVKVVRIRRLANYYYSLYLTSD